MSSTITYRQCSSITSEEAREIRARVWVYVFSCWRAKQGAACLLPPKEDDDVTSTPMPPPTLAGEERRSG